jgi:hypothetical protein
MTITATGDWSRCWRWSSGGIPRAGLALAAGVMVLVSAGCADDADPVQLDGTMIGQPGSPRVLMMAYISGLLNGQTSLAAMAVCGGQVSDGFAQSFAGKAVETALLVRTDSLPDTLSESDAFLVEVELNGEEYAGLVDVLVSPNGSCIRELSVPGAEWMWPDG